MTDLNTFSAVCLFTVQTAMFQGQISNGCIVCPAHNTAFDLKTGEVKVS